MLVRAFKYLVSFVFCTIFSVSQAQEINYSKLIENSCHICRDRGVGVVCEFEDLKKLSNLFAETLSEVRNPAMVDLYIDCQIRARKDKNADKWADSYRDKYRYYIKTTAETFGLPPQLLQCSFMKESVYNEDVRDSGAGAKGMCQIMPQTRDHIDAILKNASLRRRNGKIAKIRKQVANGTEKQIDKDYNATVLKQDDLLGMWNENFVALESQGLYPYSEGASGDNWIPSSFSNVGIKRPQNCIAAAGLYWKDTLSRLSFNIKPTTIDEIRSGSRDGFDVNATKDLMLILGAAYNAGPGTVNKIIKTVEKPVTLKNIVSKLENSKIKEMTDYMESLRNCVELGNYNPPARWYGEKHPKPVCDELQEADKLPHALKMENWLR